MDSDARWPGGGIDLRNTYTCNDPTRSTSCRGVCVQRQWFDSLTLLYSQPHLVPGLFYFFLSFQDYLVPSAFITGGFRMGADNQWDRDIPSISVDRLGICH